jgi:hypothetical protein
MQAHCTHGGFSERAGNLENPRFLMVSALEVLPASNINGLDWQTTLAADTEAKGLFGTLANQPVTPIAIELARHFNAGGTVADAIRLVELIELRAEPKRSGRGTRLPVDWEPSAADLAYAADRLSPHRVSIEVERFRNFWTAKSGAGAAKKDWPATWRNWVLSASERYGHGGNPSPHPRTNPPSGPAPASRSPILAGMARLSQRRAAERDAEASGREMDRSLHAPRQSPAD